MAHRLCVNYRTDKCVSRVSLFYNLKLDLSLHLLADFSYCIKVHASLSAFPLNEKKSIELE